MWDVNGGATVLGSIGAIILAIYSSFTTVLLIASAGYLIACLLFLRLEPERRPPLDTPEVHDDVLQRLPEAAPEACAPNSARRKSTPFGNSTLMLLTIQSIKCDYHDNRK